jgi:23S rRNA pseudouridine1911/1915/1917 synthase
MNGEPVHFAYEEPTKERLDKFLVSRLPEFSRTRLQHMIKAGQVLVDGEAVIRAGFELEAGSQIEVRLPPTQPAGLVAEDIPLQVLFENRDLVVIEKPAGMVVHPSPGHEQGTLANAVLAHAADLDGIGGEQRPGIVHRLDKNTSGLILVAKNDHALRWLQDQFRLRRVKKTYLALCDGRPPTPVGRIEAAIGRDSSLRRKMAIVPEEKGRSAASDYLVLEEFPDHTLVEVHPETGRTHQIRLHMAFIGCPIVGDTVYGRKNPSLPLDRHFLHAARLEVQLPDEENPRTFESPLPPELLQALTGLRSQV